jgi:hypothetical protein
VIYRLKKARLSGIDFNQGLDARLLTKHHADRIAELNIKRVRLSWDHTGMEKQFLRAWQLLRKAGIAKRSIAVYCLMGFNDTPEDALYRLQTVKALGSYPVPMRYQPIDTPARNSFVHPAWTDWELKAYMRYWSQLRMSAVPFDQWLDTYRQTPAPQMRMV